MLSDGAVQPSKLAALEVDSTGGAPALPLDSCVQFELAHGMRNAGLASYKAAVSMHLLLAVLAR